MFSGKVESSKWNKKSDMSVKRKKKSHINQDTAGSWLTDRNDQHQEKQINRESRQEISITSLGKFNNVLLSRIRIDIFFIFTPSLYSTLSLLTENGLTYDLAYEV